MKKLFAAALFAFALPALAADPKPADKPAAAAKKDDKTAKKDDKAAAKKDDKGAAKKDDKATTPAAKPAAK